MGKNKPTIFLANDEAKKDLKFGTVVRKFRKSRRDCHVSLAWAKVIKDYSQRKKSHPNFGVINDLVKSKEDFYHLKLVVKTFLETSGSKLDKSFLSKIDTQPVGYFSTQRVLLKLASKDVNLEELRGVARAKALKMKEAAAVEAVVTWLTTSVVEEVVAEKETVLS